MAREVKTNAMRILEKNKIEYEINTYECGEFVSGTAIAKMLNQDCGMSFKTLVAVGKSGNYYVFLIPVDKELDMKRAAGAVGEKNVELIHVKDINKVTGYVRGGVSPIGMKKRYPTVVDESAAAHEKVIISGGRIGVQIIISPEGLLKAAGARYADLA